MECGGRYQSKFQIDLDKTPNLDHIDQLEIRFESMLRPCGMREDSDVFGGCMFWQKARKSACITLVGSIDQERIVCLSFTWLWMMHVDSFCDLKSGIKWLLRLFAFDL